VRGQGFRLVDLSVLGMCSAGALLFLTWVNPANAQSQSEPTWLNVTSHLTGRYGHAVAYDAVRRQVVLFGGWRPLWPAEWLNDTWVWDGTDWVQKFPATSPPPRPDHAMAYDAARGQVVLFGGWDGSHLLNDTWVWEGSNWVQKFPTTTPPARRGHAMAYDAARGQVVLFGGFGGSAALNDTWVWDGANWVQKFPATSPPVRGGHSMAYDAGRGEVVLFGGSGMNDTWVWDGLKWVQKFPANSPPVRGGHSMAYDAGRGEVALFGGSGSSGGLNDTWVWDGVNWVQKFPTTTPPARSGHAMAYDAARGRVVLFGGERSSNVLLEDTWVWDGVDWMQKVSVTSPRARSWHAMTYDAARGQVVLFGGSGMNDTWVWDGLKWVQKFPANSPPGRSGHAMAYDVALGQVVLFGGWDGSAALNDTWVWDGANWVQKFPVSSPPARHSHAMAYDAARGQVVLFGGASGSVLLNDTWVWDGTDWTQKLPVTSPPARRGHSMARDAAQGQVVLFGGGTGSGGFVTLLNDTWVWNGANWEQKFPVARPPARDFPTMAHDAARRYVVLFGGQHWNDTWAWDGTNWVQKFPSTSPPSALFYAMAYDAARGRLVLYGGPGRDAAWVYDVPPLGPRPRLATPGSGQGPAQEFTVVFDHPSSWRPLEVVNMLLNFWLDGRQACYLAYEPGSNALYLVDDTGNAGGPFVGGLILGGDTHSIRNSQCTIHGDGSWSELDNTQVRLHLKVDFAPSFSGTKVVYLAARSATENSGWQRLGVWKVPGGVTAPNTPQVLRVVPAEWTGVGPETIEVQVTDPDGAGDLAVVNVLVNDWLDGRQACYVAYVPALNAVFLVDDAGNAGGPFAGGLLLGTSQMATNSQCTLYGQGSSATASGTDLSLRLWMEFKQPTFQGNRVVYAAARDQAGNNSGWQAVGRRTVP